LLGVVGGLAPQIELDLQRIHAGVQQVRVQRMPEAVRRENTIPELELPILETCCEVLAATLSI
jgi:hypothetical protein